MDKNKCLAKLEEEREHSAFLEMLLRTLYGDDWNKLTISDAQKWNTKHIVSRPSVQDGTAKCCVHPRGYIKSVRICGLCGEQM